MVGVFLMLMALFAVVIFLLFRNARRLVKEEHGRSGDAPVKDKKDMTPEQQKLRARLWVFMAEIMEVTNNRMVQMSFQRLVSEGRVSGLELEELKANARNKNRELEIESLRAALAATGDRQFQTACYKELKAIARIAGGETKEAFRRIFDGLDMGR